jgi:hypothetical protein
LSDTFIRTNNYNKTNISHKKNEILLHVVSIGLVALVVALVATMIVIFVNNITQKDIKSSNNNKIADDDMVIIEEDDDLTEEKWKKIYRRHRFYNYLKSLKISESLPENIDYGNTNSKKIENINEGYKYLIYDFDEDNDEELIITLQNNGNGEESALVYDFEFEREDQVYARMMSLSDYNNWKSSLVDNLPDNNKLKDIEQFDFLGVMIMKICV